MLFYLVQVITSNTIIVIGIKIGEQKDTGNEERGSNCSVEQTPNLDPLATPVNIRSV
jgi:hypothetical protein